MWATPEDCAAARAAATAPGADTDAAARPATKRRRISPAESRSPRAYALALAIASRGRSSPGASFSKEERTRSAQSAAHAATNRRSVSLSDCGESTLPCSHRMRQMSGWSEGRRRHAHASGLWKPRPRRGSHASSRDGRGYPMSSDRDSLGELSNGRGLARTELLYLTRNVVTKAEQQDGY